jgi:hypothetical protein
MDFEDFDTAPPTDELPVAKHPDTIDILKEEFTSHSSRK